MRNVFFATGGTAGHLHPALKLAKELSEVVNVQFIGYGLSKNPYFDKKLMHFDIHAYPLKKGLWNRCKMLFFSAVGFVQSCGIFFRLRPSLVITFGAFHSAPALLAALVFRVPIVTYEHNTYPGKVLRFFSRFAKKNFVVFEEAKKWMKNNVDTCQPLIDLVQTKEDPYEYFHLDPKKKTLLIFGGSQGAKSVNAALKSALHELEEKSEHWQILHFIGFNCDLLQMEHTYEKLGFTYCVEPFCRRMDLALKVCDFAITRSGAQTLLELIQYQVPSILIPYPYASEDHQLKNAQFFSTQLQGGMILLQNEEFEKNLTQSLRLVMSSEEILKSKKKLVDLFQNWQNRKCVKEQVLSLLE